MEAPETPGFSFARKIIFVFFQNKFGNKKKNYIPLLKRKDMKKSEILEEVIAVISKHSLTGICSGLSVIKSRHSSEEVTESVNSLIEQMEDPKLWVKAIEFGAYRNEIINKYFWWDKYKLYTGRGKFLAWWIRDLKSKGE